MSLRRRSVRHPIRPVPFSLHSLPCPADKLHSSLKPSKPSYLAERNILLTLTFFAFLTRVFRLSQPNAVVFDEFHFGNFMENHLTGKFAFDIHPWGGKLTLAFFARLASYRTTGFDYELRAFYPNLDYYSVRMVSAIFGTLCVPLMYLICRELQLRRLSSLLGALFPLFDSLLLIESRLILLDAQLIFYLNLTLLCALRLWAVSEEDGNQKSRRYYAYLFATSISAALAMSVKWTAAATPFLIAVVCGLGVWFLKTPTPIHHCLLAAVIGFAVYLVPWWIHLRLSTVSTEMASNVSDRFRTTLTGNDTFPFNATNNVGFAEKVWELHWRQFRANQKVKTRHAWESRWFEWPLNVRGIYYYVDKADNFTDDHPVVRILYLLLNPAMALWVFTAVASFAVLVPVMHRYRRVIPKDHCVRDIFKRGSFLLAGYLLNLLPYMLVERCYFLYHYLPALTYGQLLTALLVDSLPRIPRLLITMLMITTIVAAFVFWAPWTYCLPIDWNDIGRRQWMPRWN